MKNIQFIFAALFATVLMSRCDYVTPSKQGAAVGPVGTICDSISDSTTVKQVLIEDYTGHTCGNCPYAAYKLDTMITQNGKLIVPIAVHAGQFAYPKAPPFASD